MSACSDCTYKVIYIWIGLSICKNIPWAAQNIHVFYDWTLLHKIILIQRQLILYFALIPFYLQCLECI